MYGNRIKIKQHDITDCGAACLASVSAYYGHTLPVARIRQYAYTDKKGTNVLGMVEAADKLGFVAKGVRAQFDALHIIPKPTIAHVIVKKTLQHFVVVYKVTDTYVEYMDPADGEMHRKTHDEFKEEWTGVLILLDRKDTFVMGNEKVSMFRRFVSLLRPHRSVMTQALFGAIVYSVLGLSMSIYVGKITDYVLVDENKNLLHLMGIIMIIILVLRTFVGSMKSILALKTGQRIDATLILGYYKHLLTLPQHFFDTMRVGEIISRVNDAVKIRNFINNVSLDLVVNTLILLFSLALMFVFSWKLALVSLVSAPLFLAVYWAFNKLNKKYQRSIMESAAELESQLVESLNSITTIKRFGVEDFANIKTETRFVRLLRNTYYSIYGSIMAGNSIDFISTGVTLAILWVGSGFVIEQGMTPGTLMMFYSLIGYVLSPIGSLISANQTVQDAVIATDRLFQIMDLEREQEEGTRVDLTSEMIGDIQFEHVAFRYGSRKQVFEDLSMTIKMGKTTGIVGESGSGKTTLISLLQHIYPLQAGTITIGGYDIAQISNSSLRSRVATVPQQIELFAGTIVENISLGDLHPDMRRIMNVVELLGLKDFIDGLPQNINTMIGEHGANLSGGERQRIAIARALYKKPDILIFDEATSSLDTLSENYVKNALDKLARDGMTIIMIAHRLSTIKNADEIIVLEEGKVVETGSHQSLLERREKYWMLWRNQTQ